MLFYLLLLFFKQHISYNSYVNYIGLNSIYLCGALLTHKLTKFKFKLYRIFYILTFAVILLLNFIIYKNNIKATQNNNLFTSEENYNISKNNSQEVCSTLNTQSRTQIETQCEQKKVELVQPPVTMEDKIKIMYANRNIKHNRILAENKNKTTSKISIAQLIEDETNIRTLIEEEAEDEFLNIEIQKIHEKLKIISTIKSEVQSEIQKICENIEINFTNTLNFLGKEVSDAIYKELRIRIYQQLFGAKNEEECENMLNDAKKHTFTVELDDKTKREIRRKININSLERKTNTEITNKINALKKNIIDAVKHMIIPGYLKIKLQEYLIKNKYATTIDAESYKEIYEQHKESLYCLLYKTINDLLYSNIVHADDWRNISNDRYLSLFKIDTNSLKLECNKIQLYLNSQKK